MKKIILTTLLTAMTAIGVLAQEDPLKWDGSTTSSSLVCSDNTIEVHTAADLAALHKLWDKYDDGDRGYKNYTIKLMVDLDLDNHNFNGYTIGWDDDHKFGGTFDGQGHIIRNLKIEGKDDNRALFGKMDNGRVMNLKLVNVDIHCGDGDDCHIGAICGRMYNHSTISHCAVVGGSVRQYESGNDEFGAICGYMTNNHNSVEYCYSDVTVEADTQVGGLVGKIEQGDDHTSGIYHSYFSGKVIHYGNEYFGAICGERYGQPTVNNFFLDRGDGVRATGNQKSAGGSSYHSDGEIKACTEEELKQPLLFRNYNAGYTLESDQYVYTFDGYPELKVFLRYNHGDTFYNNSIGCMDNNADNAVPGYLKVQKNGSSPFTVSLEKIMPASSCTDFTLYDNFTPYFSNQQLRLVGIAPNAMEVLGKVNTVTIPATVDSIARPQRHQVQNAFILNGEVGAVKDGALYDLTEKYLITAPKSFPTLTIHQEFADKVADYAFADMINLRTLYVDTYVPKGTLVDDKDNKAPVIQLDGENVFSGCPSDLNVYIKDGTPNQLFLGYQGPGGYGYGNESGWSKFYSNYQDVENHMFSYFPVNRNPGGMSTLILGYPVELPEGVTAWWAKSFSDGMVVFRKLGTQVVPALTPVLLTYEGTDLLYLSRYEGDNPGAATDYESNLLKGSIDPGGHSITSSEMMSNFFTLGRPSGDSSFDNLGFYQFHPKNNLLPSYVAWFAANDVPADVRFLMVFDEDDDDETSVTLPCTDDLLPQVYTMQGIRIAPSDMRKGSMYIVNGKKVLF